MIRIGDYVEALIHVLSTYIAVDLMGFESCGCCERREWLNRLTDKEYNGNCKDIKLW